MLGRVLKEVKLPFPDDFFPEMEMAPVLQSDLHRSAFRLLHATMTDEMPVTRFHPSGKPDQWKLIGERNGLQLYRERGVAKGNAVQVNLLGQLTGTLQDVMLGLFARDSNSLKTQRAIMHSDYLDAAVLHVLDADPYSEDDTGFSFQFSGIKWLASAPSGKLVHKRDLCWHEEMGITTDPNGDEVGFVVLNSVRIDECPPFEQQGVIRSNASVCYIFRPLPNNRVSVFMKGEHGVGGKARSWSSDAVIAEMWLGMASVMECAHAKRLSKLVSSKEMFIASAPSKTCDVCDGKMKLLKSGQNCKICGKNMCDRCRMSKLIYPTRNTGNFPCNYHFCKPCLSDAKDRLFGKATTRVSFHSSDNSSGNSGSPRYRSMPRPAPSMMSSSSSGSDVYSQRGYDNRGRTGSQEPGQRQHYSDRGQRVFSPRSSGASSNMSARGTVSSDPLSYGRSVNMGGSFSSMSSAPMSWTPRDTIGNSSRSSSQPPHPPTTRPTGRSIEGRIPGPPSVSRNVSGENARRKLSSFGQQPQPGSRAPPYNNSVTSRGATSVSSSYATSNGTLSFESVYDVEGNGSYRGQRGYASEGSDYSDLDDDELQGNYSGRKQSPAQVRQPIEIIEADSGVIEVGREESPQAAPVDVFERDGLKYINTFRANEGAAAPAGASSGSAGASGANDPNSLMERLMQINMAAEATYLMAKYNSNIQENLQR